MLEETSRFGFWSVILVILTFSKKLYCRVVSIITWGIQFSLDLFQLRRWLDDASHISHTMKMVFVLKYVSLFFEQEC